MKVLKQNKAHDKLELTMKNDWSLFKPDKESQSLSGAKSGKECEEQQERLLQVYHQQKEDYRKCGFAAEWSRDLEKMD